MAAYAALVSLMNLIEQIQHHPSPPISLHQKQVESLTEKIAFLQDFLEAYNTCDDDQEVDRLRSRIADAAYAAEDVIESQIVDQITQISSSFPNTTEDQSLQIVITNMDFIGKEVMKIKGNMGTQDQLQRIITAPVVSSESPSTEKNTMVGFDDVLYEVLDKLTGQPSHQQIISISGMGGIGKTTLARNIFEKSLIKQHFDVLVWVTISQEYSIREILLEVLNCQNNYELSRNDWSQKSQEELGEAVYKSLYGRRYLIVIDDMWNIDPWNRIKFYFPDSNSGSRILITTRISKLAMCVTDTRGIELNLLDEETSWSLLGKIAFGEEVCPLELHEIGKKIAKNCKGLPLSIVVIGGLLAKSNRTLKYWEYVAENLNSIVNLEDNERCLKILYTSYKLLPVHLKSCFLYMGIFPEDTKIRVDELIELWVAEGFLKPISGKSLEVVAEEYLKHLIDRNLILIHEWGSLPGKIKSCTIHDLLRDLCLREARNDKFLRVTIQGSLKFPEGINTQRRIAIYESALMKEERFGEVHHASRFWSFTRSFICDFDEVLPSFNFRLLRVLKAVDQGQFRKIQEKYSLKAIFRLVNMRHLAIKSRYTGNMIASLHPSVCSLWNLQTLIVDVWYTKRVVAPPGIWKMPLLRHVKVKKLSLPVPPDSHEDKRIVLGNLQTLSTIGNFRCGEEVVKRIPNVKKLKVYYEDIERHRWSWEPHYCLNNIGRLQKLESLTCRFISFNRIKGDVVRNLTFPHSLKKLTLTFGELFWEEISMIGSLPLLEVLKLNRDSFTGPKWETVDGQFPSLRSLKISGCDVEYWATESTHFPFLEHLSLFEVYNLKEIPSGIGEIATLKSIVLRNCSDSLVTSAKRILDEQEEFGNEDLQVEVRVTCKKYHHQQRLATCNFQVKIG